MIILLYDLYKLYILYIMCIINVIKFLKHYFDAILNNNEKLLLLQTNKKCKSIDFKITTKKLNIGLFGPSIKNLELAVKNNYELKIITSYYVKDIETLKYLEYNKCSFNWITFSYMSLNGNLENMKWLLYENKITDFDNDINCNIFNNAASNGNLENMMWLYENSFKFNNATFECAILNGNLENIIWLYNNNCFYNDFDIMKCAYIKGNLDNIKWLIDNCIDKDQYYIDDENLIYNIKHNNNDVIMFLLKNINLAISDKLYNFIEKKFNIQIQI